MTYHPIIVQNFLKFLMLYLLEMLFLNHYNIWGLLKAKKKSLIYILIMRVSFFLIDMRILELVFSGLNFRVLRNLITF